MKRGAIGAALVLAVAALTWACSLTAQVVGPPGFGARPDFLQQGHFVPLRSANWNADPDFPVVFLGNLAEEFPQYVLMVVDARNGKETWSLGEDPVILYFLFSDDRTIRQVLLDRGFVERGHPSGQFLAGGPEAVKDFVARLEEGQRRFRPTSSL